MLCYASLTAVFVIQFTQGIVAFGLVAAVLGAVCVRWRLRLGPIIFLNVFAIGQLRANSAFFGVRSVRDLNLEEFVLAAAVVAFVACHYRLQGIWHGTIPVESGTHRETTSRPVEKIAAR